MSGASGSTAHGSLYKLPKHCSGCDLAEREGEKFKWCQSCHCTSYCGRECQKADWPRHKPICKEHQQGLRLCQEVHGDEGALAVKCQSQWYTLVKSHLYALMATLLEDKRDTHIIALTTERLEKRPYFKVQDYKVVSVDAVAVEFPGMDTKVIQDQMHTLKMENRQATHASGLIVITCSNEPMLPDMITTLTRVADPENKLLHLPIVDILRTINGEPRT